MKTQFMRPKLAFLSMAAGVLSGVPMVASGEGHGPMFGLATPTLGRGQWSSDTSVMAMRTEAGTRVTATEMLGYGFTEDLQGILSLPLARDRDTDMMPRTRGGTMASGAEEVEAALLWRFHRMAPAVGTRRESALLAGISQPLDAERNGVALGPAANLAAVTGYASRIHYWWVGAGGQFYSERNRDRPGALYYTTVVYGWRPPLFRHDYPRPDWRLFIEAVAEHSEPDRIGGQLQGDSGGDKVLLGPSILGLYGQWGLELGAIAPVAQSLKGAQPEEDVRAKAVFTYWL